MNCVDLPKAMVCYPTVFAVGNVYKIFMPFSEQAILKVTVGDTDYFDDCNGVMRSNTEMHTVQVPMSELDFHKSYTVKFRKVIERKPYYPTFEDEVAVSFDFKPLEKTENINIYHISDAHNLVESPVKAGSFFGDDLDLLVLNGDIPNHGGAVQNFFAICKIASGITKGGVPCICSRGNHDDRGLFAEEMPNYIPTHNGKTYYTTRLGNVWALVLDCGEDKPDEGVEYGGTVCFHPFRLKETEFIKSVIENAKNEYEAEGIEHKLVIVHNPFTFVNVPPFNIEIELYTEWAKLLKDNVKPELLLCGHAHITRICEVGCDRDHLGQPCPMVIGSEPKLSQPYGFTGCALTLNNNTARVVFNNDLGEIRLDEKIKL
jgi:hypothetical protein